MYDQWHFTCFNLKTGVRTSNIIIALYFPPSIWQICRICRGFTNTSHLVYNRKPKPQSVTKCCLKSSRVGQLPQKCWGTFIWKHAWLPCSKSKAIRKMARTSTSKSSAKVTPLGNSAIQSVPIVSEKEHLPTKTSDSFDLSISATVALQVSIHQSEYITNALTTKISRRSQGLWSANLSEIRWKGQN